MSESPLLSELREQLKVKEAQLANVESQRDMLRHECNSLRETIRIMTCTEIKTIRTRLYHKN